MPAYSATRMRERRLGPGGLLNHLWWRPAVRGLRASSSSEAVRLLAFGLLTLLFLATLYSIFKPVTAFLWSQPELGPVLSARVVSLVFTLLFLMLGFSSLLAFLSRLVFAEDAPLFAASPLPPAVYFEWRLWQAFLASTWMILLLWFPYLWALRKAVGAGPLFFLWGALAPWPLAALASALAAGLLSALVLRLRPQRLRAGLFAVAVIAGLSGLLGLRFARPERLADPQQAQTVAKYLASLDRLEPVWWPATWTSRAVMRSLDAPGEAVLWWLLSVAVAVAVWRIVCSAFGARAWQLWWQGQEGEGEGHGAGGHGAFQFKRRPPAWRVLLERDSLALWRAPGQRLQALLLLTLVVLFVFSLARLPLGEDQGLREMLFLPVCLLAQVILLAVSARFIFPAGSLEKPGAWLLFSAPVPAGDHLKAKVALAVMLLAPLSLLLAGVVVHVFQPGTAALLTGLINFTATPLMLACLDVGLGVSWASPDAGSAEDVVGSPSGVLVMVVGFFILLLQNAVMAVPLREAWMAGMLPQYHLRWPAVGLTLFLWLVLQGLAVGLPLRWAWQRIQGRRE